MSAGESFRDELAREGARALVAALTVAVGLVGLPALGDWLDTRGQAKPDPSSHRGRASGLPTDGA